MAILHVARHLRHVHRLQRLLVGFAEVNAHFLHAGGDHQHIGADLSGQQRGGEIFVDHRIHALVVALLGTHYGNAAAARADHHKAFLRQGLDGIGFDDTHRLRRGHHAAVSAARILNEMPVGMSLLKRVPLGFAEKRANRFGGMGKAGIVFIHFHLGDHRHRLLFAAGGKAVVQRLLDQIADPALGIGHAVCQRGERQSFPLVGNFGPAQIQPHLGTVAVCKHDVIVGGQHFQHRLRDRFHRLRLVFNRLAGVIFDNAVAADGDDHELFHTFSFVTVRSGPLTPALSP